MQNKEILFVTGTGGLGDYSYNDAGFSGIRKSIRELGAKVELVDFNEVPELSKSIFHCAAAKEKYSIIIGLGFYHEKSINAAAKSFPKQKFILIDGHSFLPNVKGVIFKEQESAFLAGILASLLTRQFSKVNNKLIGIILGIEAYHLTRYIYAYKAGVKTIDKEMEILFDVVGNFQNREKCTNLALGQIKKGVNVIYQVAGFAGLGVFDAISEKGGYAIGEGLNQNHLHPDFIIASTFKNMDLVAFDAIKEVLSNKFCGGTFYYGFKESQLCLDFRGSNVIVSKEIRKILEAYKQKIICNSIIPPKTKEEYDRYFKELV